jgi:colanic acid/amylovoran biosynthesis glycosyltransferase
VLAFRNCPTPNDSAALESGRKLQVMTRTVLHRCSVWLPTTENWIYNQVHYCDGGFEQHVACLKLENPGRFPVPVLHRFPNASLLGRLRRTGLPGLRGRVTELPWLWRCLRRIRPAVVHSHFGDSGYEAAGMLSKMGIKHVVTFYGYDVNRLPLVFPEWKKRYRALFRLANLFLCEGSHMAGCLIALGCPRDKIKVQHLGVEIDRILFTPRKWTPSSPFRVLITASFREKKGIPDALQALAKVRSELPLEVTIIGDASAHPKDQREKEKILAVLGETGLNNCTRLLGYQPHEVLWQEALTHHLFLQPSLTASDGDTEGGAPVTLIEMAASGMPIVSTRHCDIPGIVLDGETGLLAEERNANELAAHITQLSRHPGTWLSMLQKGRQHIERNFSCIIQGQKLAQLYHGLLGAHAN